MVLLVVVVGKKCHHYLQVKQIRLELNRNVSAFEAGSNRVQSRSVAARVQRRERSEIVAPEKDIVSVPTRLQKTSHSKGAKLQALLGVHWNRLARLLSVL
jgi:hypothetical protein